MNEIRIDRDKQTERETGEELRKGNNNEKKKKTDKEDNREIVESSIHL